MGCTANRVAHNNDDLAALNSNAPVSMETLYPPNNSENIRSSRTETRPCRRMLGTWK